MSRATGYLHRLDRAGTEVWRVLAAASPEPLAVDALLARMEGGAASLERKELEGLLCDLELAGLLESRSDLAVSGERAATPRSAANADARPVVRPRQRRIEDCWELGFEIEAAPNALAQPVGDGYLMRSPDGTLDLLAGEAALLWRLVSSAPRTYAELLDAVCERSGSPYQNVERVVLPLIASWSAGGAIRGLEQVESVRAETPPAARALGRLDLMRLAAAPARPPVLGGSPTLNDPDTTIEHVAIVCQYGIHGLAPGVEPYTRRCIARLRKLQPDLIILSGGGRHGLSDLREAESVIDRYRALLPERALWLEKHSETTWENLQRSLELLRARSIVPRRITFLGDRARTEKLRLACWLARRRFASFGAVRFRVVPVTRPRFTWKDSRAVQIVVGTAQVLHESRGTALAAAASASASSVSPTFAAGDGAA